MNFAPHHRLTVNFPFGVLVALVGLCVAAPLPASIIGYGSSNAVIPAKDQELFSLGFEAGFRFETGSSPNLDTLIVRHDTTGAQLGSLRAFEELMKSNVQVITGFPTSHEALLVAPLVASRKLFSLFPAASHSDLAKFGPYVFSTGETMRDCVEAALTFAQKTFGKSRGAVLVDSSAVYSTDQRKIVEELVRDGQVPQLSLELFPLGPDRLLSAEDLARLRKNQVKFVYFTQYASASREVMGQLQAEGLDIALVANSSWLTGDIDFVRRYLLPKRLPLYAVGVWLQDLPESRAFDTFIKKIYGVSPTPEIAYGFDAGLIMARTLKQASAHPPVTADSFRKAFLDIRCFEGTSSGRLCFPESGGHARRAVHVVRFTKTGFRRAN
jgi:ABC-type branched-subunit amino acid transport system substrate-binding protein